MPALPTTMKLINWNVWRLKKDQAFIELKKILREHKPEILFLCETKLKGRLMNRKVVALNFQNCLAVDSSGKRGGLAMMWGENVTMEVKSYSKHHIDVVVQRKVACGTAQGFMVTQRLKRKSTLGN